MIFGGMKRGIEEGVREGMQEGLKPLGILKIINDWLTKNADRLICDRTEDGVKVWLSGGKWTAEGSTFFAAVADAMTRETKEKAERE